MSRNQELDGRKYEIIFGSDIQRDGVFLELSDCSEQPQSVVAEAFFYDEIDKVVFNFYRQELPFQLVEWLLQEVKKQKWPV